uniref:Uncharacterized protein n=1 Tax=viral metagenome TaxID=1070528 RepID=A0A6C0CCT7_9ZZZZ
MSAANTKKSKHDILRQNLNDLNNISERLLEDVKTRNSILQKGLDQSQNSANIVTNLKGGSKK